jgi:hypothetical protein
MGPKAAARGWRLLAAAALVAGALAPAPALAADTVTLTATYMISISGLNVGRADVKGRFTAKGYAAAIRGSTYGVSRFVSDASATLAGSGRVSGTSVLPASYNLQTSESGFQTSVSMTMRGGSVIGLQAIPNLPTASDRVALTGGHKQNVVDPIGAFVVPLGTGKPSSRACNRTIRVFDGWKRFDIRLSYRETKPVASSDFTGDVIVCSARYVAVAGHRSGDESVEYMSGNDKLEIWLAQVEGTAFMVPYHILIGTPAGDLVIKARTFAATPGTGPATTN